MKTKVSTVLMSHLSDIKIEHYVDDSDYHSRINTRCEFCKFLILKFPNTDTEIDPDKEYMLFLNEYNLSPEIILQLKRTEARTIITELQELMDQDQGVGDDTTKYYQDIIDKLQNAL